MARVAAKTLCGEDAAFRPVQTATQLKVTGVSLYSAGDFAEAEDREEIVLRDATSGVYKRLVLKNDRLIGAVLYGDTGDGPWFFDLVRAGTDTSDMRDTLIFGESFGNSSRLDPYGGRCSLAG
jgi:nitrite reductase (NADH) large subunit